MGLAGSCCAERPTGFRNEKRPGNAVEDGFPGLFVDVREGGLEPPRPYEHKILNLACLPIPPLSGSDFFNVFTGLSE